MNPVERVLMGAAIKAILATHDLDETEYLKAYREALMKLSPEDLATYKRRALRMASVVGGIR